LVVKRVADDLFSNPSQQTLGHGVLNRSGETPIRLRKKNKAAPKIKLLLTEYLKDATVRLVIWVIREDRNLSRSRGV
jgi:hypothetical protein